MSNESLRVRWRGIFKLCEEMGEVQQILGKLGPFPDGNHPDGAGNLKERLEDELGDLLAAVKYIIHSNDLNHVKINERAGKKYATFDRWLLSGISTPD